MGSTDQESLRSLLGLVEEAVTRGVLGHDIDREAVEDRVAEFTASERSSIQQIGYRTFGVARELVELVGRRLEGPVPAETPGPLDEHSHKRHLVALGKVLSLLPVMLAVPGDDAASRGVAVVDVLDLHEQPALRRVAKVGELAVYALGLVLLAIENQQGGSR